MGSSSTGSPSVAMVPAPPSNTVAVSGGKYIPPKPGVNGAPHGALAGKTVVMTGLFPEIGGGSGLGLGKDRLKAILTAFGARVTGSVSGKTDILITGKEPGMAKVKQARALGILVGTWSCGICVTSRSVSRAASRPSRDLPRRKWKSPPSLKATSSRAVEALFLRASDDDRAVAMGYKDAPLLIKGKRGQTKKRALKEEEEEEKEDYDDYPTPAPPDPAVDVWAINCDMCGDSCSDVSFFVDEGEGLDICENCIEVAPDEWRGLSASSRELTPLSLPRPSPREHGRPANRHVATHSSKR